MNAFNQTLHSLSVFSMPRSFQHVLLQIHHIVKTSCDDEILRTKWFSEFAWFEHFERTKCVTYFNLSPEALEELRWRKLGFVLDACISVQPFMYDWERRVVNIFMDKDTGNNLPSNRETHTIDITEVASCDEYEKDPYYEYQYRLT